MDCPIRVSRHRWPPVQIDSSLAPEVNLND